MTTEATVKSVFISYSSAEQGSAESVRSYLEQSGVGCWMAPGDIEPGRSYAEAIIAAIGRCRVMVVVFSANANASEQVLREVERAVSHGRKVLITFRIEDAAPTGAMEYFLSAHQWVDAFSPPLERHLELLGRNLSRMLDGQPEAPAPDPRPGPAAAAPLKSLRAVINPARPEEIHEFIASCREAAEGRNTDPAALANISCVLWELLANAAEHGCRYDPAARIEAACDLWNSHANIAVEDSGAGFSAEETIAKLNQNYDLDQQRGRGLMIVRFLSQRVDFGNGGRRVEAVVAAPKAKPGRQEKPAWRPKQVIGDTVVLMVPEDANTALDEVGPEMDMMRDLSFRKFALDWSLAETSPSNLMTVLFLAQVRAIQKDGGAVVFFNVGAKLYALLKQMRFTQIIPVRYSLQDALQYLSGV
jgi:anti-sigma regulatory factor (Ser/Thr protein kinase)